jgi:N,N'-diacetyllegionaminate synthase
MASKHAFVIAEIGVNHNGDVKLAEEMVLAAAKCGADAVKFQTFTARHATSSKARKAAYQVANTGDAGESYRDMLVRLELSKEDHLAIKHAAERAGVVFFSKPADPESADLLESIGVELYKIGSSDVTNLPLIRHVAGKHKPIILSTGMATMGEVAVALEAIERVSSQEVSLLHCTSEYPCPFSDVNLRAMATLEAAFGRTVGYSDHTLGIEIAVAAVAMGARILEKHFTLDRRQPGPDHKASLEPDEFRAMVEAIRHVETAFGDGVKRPAKSELANIDVVRRSVVATRDLPAGHVIGPGDVTIKRPGTGIAPADLEKIVGLRLASPVKGDDVVTWDHIKPDAGTSSHN